MLRCIVMQVPYTLVTALKFSVQLHGLCSETPPKSCLMSSGGRHLGLGHGRKKQTSTFHVKQVFECALPCVAAAPMPPLQLANLSEPFSSHGVVSLAREVEKCATGSLIELSSEL